MNMNTTPSSKTARLIAAILLPLISTVAHAWTCGGGGGMTSIGFFNGRPMQSSNISAIVAASCDEHLFEDYPNILITLGARKPLGKNYTSTLTPNQITEEIVANDANTTGLSVQGGNSLVARAAVSYNFTDTTSAGFYVDAGPEALFTHNTLTDGVIRTTDSLPNLTYGLVVQTELAQPILNRRVTFSSEFTVDILPISANAQTQAIYPKVNFIFLFDFNAQDPE